jgi:hypothetical protein
MGNVEFLESHRISDTRIPTEGHYYTALGYSVSRNERAIDHAARSIINRRSIYTGTVVDLPRLAAKLGITGHEHLFLRYPKYSFRSDGRSVNSVKPVGFSGGSLLDLGDFSAAASFTGNRQTSARLSAMLIEYHRDHRALIAVKIGPIIDGIRRALR